MVGTPFNQIEKLLSKELPLELINRIPAKWEKIGEVLTIVLAAELNPYKELISKRYAEVLNCKTVLNDVGGISGDLREPKVELLYGSENTETIHKENGIRYKLDPRKVMFSSGNMDERIRMATISNKSETVVDLFAGIGYFTLPIAVYSKPKKIFACEKNPASYDYLCKNIVLNNVTNIVEPLKGDNRKIAPKNIADRVIMGYLDETERFLPTALACLKDYKGVVHYHEKIPEDKFPDEPLKKIKKVADKYDRIVKLLKHEHVKSYAPGISHYVLDVEIGE